ncbi:MAG: hypothetical protein AMS19_10085 [Gemmatimonas sp. SG8_23]|jgi:hypothetical protein|nr:MAG: hypothetical protein AMS19_10085 [Gemmatimonas sp. SG8_23]
MTGIIVVAALALVGCQDEGPTALDAEFSVHEAGANPARPFEGNFAGTMAVVGPCGAEGQVMFHVAGEGHATHLGRTTLSIEFCQDWATGPTEDLFAVYTAANGDEVWMRAEGEGFDMGSSEYEVWGGTGRFEDADGLLQVVGTLNPVDFTWTTSVTGWITY